MKITASENDKRHITNVAITPGIQGYNEVRWRPGARSKFGASMLEPEVFPRQICCIEESTCNIVGTFRRPRSDLALP